jgi:hypothetical protein
LGLFNVNGVKQLRWFFLMLACRLSNPKETEDKAKTNHKNIFSNAETKIQPI